MDFGNKVNVAYLESSESAHSLRATVEFRCHDFCFRLAKEDGGGVVIALDDEDVLGEHDELEWGGCKRGQERWDFSLLLLFFFFSFSFL